MACYKKIFIFISIFFAFIIFNNSSCLADSFDADTLTVTIGSSTTNTEYNTFEFDIQNVLAYNPASSESSTVTENNRSPNVHFTFFVPKSSAYTNYIFACDKGNSSVPFATFLYSANALYFTPNASDFTSIRVGGYNNRCNYKEFEFTTLSNYKSYLVSQNFNINFYVENANAYVNTQITYLPYSFPFYKNSILNSDKQVYLSSKDILYNNDVVFEAPVNNTIKPPNISTPLQDLENLNFSALGINAWSYSTNQDLELLVYDRNFVGDDVRNLYPINRIKLNWDSPYYVEELTTNPNTNSLYLIPIEDLGLKFQLNGTYAFRFGIKDGESYNYLGDTTVFTLSQNVTSEVINNINNKVQNTIEENRHNQTINELNNIQQQNQQFQNNILDTNISSDTNNDINNSLDYNNNNQDITNINNGFFTRLTSLVSNLADYDLNDVEQVSLPIPNSNQNLVLYSNTISANIPAFLLTFIQSFWWFIFSMYLYKFINKIYISISSGNVLHGFTNNDEVITNNML